MSNRILLVTDDASDAGILKHVLDRARDGPFEIVWVTNLALAVERLRSGDIDAILLDLELPDSSGIATFERMFEVASHTPIMTLSPDDEEPLAIEAVQRGAQGYLSKGHFASYLVPQALRNIIHRKAVEEAFYKEKTRAEIALNSIGDAVLCTDLSANVVYLNTAAEHMTGWSREEANGHPVGDVFRIIDGGTGKPILDTVDLVQLHDKERGLPAHTVLVRRDGGEAPIEDSASPIHDWNGNLTGTVIVFHDVSAAHAMTMKMTAVFP